MWQKSYILNHFSLNCFPQMPLNNLNVTYRLHYVKSFKDDKLIIHIPTGKYFLLFLLLPSKCPLENSLYAIK